MLSPINIINPLRNTESECDMASTSKSVKTIQGLIKDKNYEEALNVIKVALKVDSSNYHLLVFGGNALFNTGKVIIHVYFCI
jgi:hypothetical protein